MDPRTTHGAFSWNELMTTDPARAADFYHQLFGWSVETMAMPQGPYRIVKVDGEPAGGIMGMPPGAPATMRPCWGGYVTVDNVDEMAAECAALGGKVLVSPTDIAGVGRFAVLQDPQGAFFNIIDYLDT
ncbi:MAG: hypothetical protein RL456_1980 [Pseudomonadota bacterium]|jgi:predicted enzyme related to lactoylglutathione lyase